MKSMSRRALLAIACGLVLAGLSLGLAPRVFSRVADQVARAAVATVVAGTASAEDMKFEPLSSDSASTLERRRSRRSSTSASSSAIPALPAVPAPPPVPDAPSVIIGKSGDIMRVGSDVVIGKDDVVTGDVLAVGGDLTIEGHVEGNAVSMGGDVYLQPSARVDGDVVCMGGELHEESGAVVGGKRVVGLGGKNDRAGRHFRQDSDSDAAEGRTRREANALGSSIASLIIWLLLCWAIVKITPGRTSAALDSYRRGPGTAFLVGWLALVLTVPGLIAVALLTALLCITIIGIPLGIAVLFGYFLFLAIFVVWGAAVGAAVIGERIAMRRGIASPTLMRAMITGVLVLDGAMVAAQILRLVPVFSGFGMFAWVVILIASILISVAGWGALLHSEFTTGLLARWWHGRRGGPAAKPAPPPLEPAPGDLAPGGSGTAVTTVAVPSVQTPSTAPPTPPGAFMPPPEPPPPGSPPGA
ncbi:MAG: hypothetical protein ABIS67_10785 [Candidatus Eisenbacteria bacterium]